ncbi:MAG: hypothetical protein L0Z50_17835 [Verrucomicrobiales bacterium]|nr:hypothetical protein [Verrucomicrobiales bacterium]
MPQEMEKRRSRVDKLLKKVFGRRFTFEASQADLELLRSICAGTYEKTKPGDPTFRAYAAAVNVATEFASQALDIPELIPFNNQLAELQEEYMPSYPPISPVTSAFFAGWMVLDARDSITGLTLGELFVRYLKHVGKFDYLRKLMDTLNDSYCSFYEVMEVDAHGVKLSDIARQREIRCWNSSGYAGRQGEVWYVRLLPPFVDASSHSVTVSTPYVARDSSRRTWEAFFQRHMASETAAGRSLQDYLKYGKFLGYWLEFVFQAFTGYTGNMIVVTGVPDDPASLPHSHPKRKL